MPGLRMLLMLLLALVTGSYFKVIDPLFIAHHAGELFCTANLLVFLLSVYLYMVGRKSRSKSASLRAHSTGSLFWDWWNGVQLNPMVPFFGLDFKFFVLRPGMMGWLLINLSLAAKQYHLFGTLHTPMLLFQLFTGFYVFDYFWHEEYMLSTWDIIAEKFGYMLAFGDLVWIPFIFSLQGWWLMEDRRQLAPATVAGLVALYLLGYTLFRGCNSQKHRFKQDRNCVIWGKRAETVGGKLLVSGFWGIARKINYLGDILLGLSYSLPAGFGSFWPYVYPTYLTLLLIHRGRRDEERCADKYKEVWTAYCKRVPYRIVPLLY
eukprot:jgi/Mesvir1/25740/Mv01920-RA.1